MIMISCEKAAHIMDKKGVEKLSTKEKITLWAHNLHCKACRVYATFSKRFLQAIKSTKENTPNLTKQEKEAFKNKLSNS